MTDHCPLCNYRISNWELATNKVVILSQGYFHKSCLQDYKLKYGKDHEAMKGVGKETRKSIYGGQ